MPNLLNSREKCHGGHAQAQRRTDVSSKESNRIGDRQPSLVRGSLSDLSPLGVAAVIGLCAVILGIAAYFFYDPAEKETAWIFYIPLWLTTWFALLGWFVKSNAELRSRGQRLLVGSVAIAFAGRGLFEPGLASVQSVQEVHVALEHLANGVSQLILIAGAAVGANFVSAAWMDKEAQRNERPAKQEIADALNRIADAAQRIAVANEHSAAIANQPNRADAPLLLKVVETIITHYGRR